MSETTEVLGYEFEQSQAIELVVVLSLQGAILLFGVALGATWVGSSVSMAGCGVVSTTGPCSVLGGVESWTMNFAIVSAGGFILAMGIERYQMGTDGECDDSRTAVKGNQGVSDD